MTDSSEFESAGDRQSQLERVGESVVKRIVDRCNLLTGSTDDVKGLTRVFCSPAMQHAHQQLAGWFEDAQLDYVLDPVGNLIGRPCPSEVVRSPAVFMIGSHVDTVINAGRFDGSLGVLLGLGAIEVLKAANIELNFEIHIVAFSDEEGVRYQMPFIGSRGIAETIESADFDRVDADGIKMHQALENFGCQPGKFKLASYANENLIGFLEAHMEQATVLQADNLPVGVVSAIAGQTRATITFEGQSGHAGTVPHNCRRDALAAAAELILQVERLGQEVGGLFATVGNVIATPGLSNVIAGRAELRLDLRHEFDEERLAAFEKVSQFVEGVSQSRAIDGSVTSVQHSSAVSMDPAISAQLINSIEELGLEAKLMVSGAGHDAMIMSRITPSGMLFVRCRDGISHHPDEFVSADDIAVALKVMVGVLMKASEARGGV